MAPPYLRTLRRDLLRLRPQLAELLQACDQPELPPGQVLDQALNLATALHLAVRRAIVSALESLC